MAQYPTQGESPWGDKLRDYINRAEGSAVAAAADSAESAALAAAAETEAKAAVQGAVASINAATLAGTQSISAAAVAGTQSISSATTTSLQALNPLVTEAGEAADRAEFYANLAEEISGLTGEDQAVAALLANKTSQVNLASRRLVGTDAIRATTFEPLIGTLGSTDPAVNTAIVKQAFAAAEAAGGVNVILPERFIRLNEGLVLPVVGQRAVGLIGGGKTKTILKWVTDLGPNAFGIRSGSRMSTAGHWLEGFGIVPPVERRTIGVVENQMEGIEVCRRMTLLDVQARFFKAGIRLVGDHIEMQNCVFSANYYGVYTTDSPTLGDINCIDVDMSGNAFASIAVGPNSNFLTSISFIRGHLGFGPYGIYIEPGAVTSGSMAMQYTYFIGTSFEFFGNGAIYDEGNNARFLGLHFIMCSNFTMDAIHAIADRAKPALFKLGSMERWKMDDVIISGGSGPADAIFSATSVTESEYRGNIADLVSGYINAGKQVLAPMSQGPDLRIAGPINARVRRAVSAITKNTLVGFATLNGAIPHTGNEQLLGVAFNTTTVANEGVIVQEAGERVQVVTNTALPVNSRLVVDPTTPTRVAALSSYPDAPVVGTLWFGDSTAGSTVQAVFRVVSTSKALVVPVPAGFPAQKYNAGSYYSAPGARSTVTRADSTMTLLPFRVDTQWTFTGVAMEVTTAGSAGALVRLGIYSMDSSGRPHTRVADLGTVDATATGVKTITGQSLALAPGWYGLAAVVQGAPTTTPSMRVVTAPNVVPGAPQTTANLAGGAGWQRASVSGVLPDNIATTTVPADTAIVVALIA